MPSRILLTFDRHGDIVEIHPPALPLIAAARKGPRAAPPPVQAEQLALSPLVRR